METLSHSIFDADEQGFQERVIREHEGAVNLVKVEVDDNMRLGPAGQISLKFSPCLPTPNIKYDE